MQLKGLMRNMKSHMAVLMRTYNYDELCTRMEESYCTVVKAGKDCYKCQKQNRIKKFRVILQQFLALCHAVKQDILVQGKNDRDLTFDDLLSACAAYFIGVTLRSNDLTDKQKASVLCLHLFLLLGDSPEHLLNAILLSGRITEPTVHIHFKIFKKLIKSSTSLAEETLIRLLILTKRLMVFLSTKQQLKVEALLCQVNVNQKVVKRICNTLEHNDDPKIRRELKTAFSLLKIASLKRWNKLWKVLAKDLKSSLGNLLKGRQLLKNIEKQSTMPQSALFFLDRKSADTVTHSSVRRVTNEDVSTKKISWLTNLIAEVAVEDTPNSPIISNEKALDNLEASKLADDSSVCVNHSDVNIDDTHGFGLDTSSNKISDLVVKMPQTNQSRASPSKPEPVKVERPVKKHKRKKTSVSMNDGVINNSEVIYNGNLFNILIKAGGLCTAVEGKMILNRSEYDDVSVMKSNDEDDDSLKLRTMPAIEPKDTNMPPCETNVLLDGKGINAGSSDTSMPLTLMRNLKSYKECNNTSVLSYEFEQEQFQCSASDLQIKNKTTSCSDKKLKKLKTSNDNSPFIETTTTKQDLHPQKGVPDKDFIDLEDDQNSSRETGLNINVASSFLEKSILVSDEDLNKKTPLSSGKLNKFKASKSNSPFIETTTNNEVLHSPNGVSDKDIGNFKDDLFTSPLQETGSTMNTESSFISNERNNDRRVSGEHLGGCDAVGSDEASKNKYTHIAAFPYSNEMSSNDSVIEVNVGNVDDTIIREVPCTKPETKETFPTLNKNQCSKGVGDTESPILDSSANEDKRTIDEIIISESVIELNSDSDTNNSSVTTVEREFPARPDIKSTKTDAKQPSRQTRSMTGAGSRIKETSNKNSSSEIQRSRKAFELNEFLDDECSEDNRLEDEMSSCNDNDGFINDGSSSENSFTSDRQLEENSSSAEEHNSDPELDKNRKRGLHRLTKKQSELVSFKSSEGNKVENRRLLRSRNEFLDEECSEDNKLEDDMSSSNEDYSYLNSGSSSENSNLSDRQCEGNPSSAEEHNSDKELDRRKKTLRSASTKKRKLYTLESSDDSEEERKSMEDGTHGQCKTNDHHNSRELTVSLEKKSRGLDALDSDSEGATEWRPTSKSDLNKMTNSYKTRLAKSCDLPRISKKLFNSNVELPSKSKMLLSPIVAVNDVLKEAAGDDDDNDDEEAEKAVDVSGTKTIKSADVNDRRKQENVFHSMTLRSHKRIRRSFEQSRSPLKDASIQQGCFTTSKKGTPNRERKRQSIPRKKLFTPQLNESNADHQQGLLATSKKGKPNREVKRQSIPRKNLFTPQLNASTYALRPRCQSCHCVPKQENGHVSY